MKERVNNTLELAIGGLISVLFVGALSLLFFTKKKEIEQGLDVYEEEFLGV